MAKRANVVFRKKKKKKKILIRETCESSRICHPNRKRVFFRQIDIIRTWPSPLFVNPCNNCLIAIDLLALLVFHEKLHARASARTLRNNEPTIYSARPHVYLRKGGFT